MSLAAGKASVVNVLLIIGIWVSFPDVCSLPKWRELTTVLLKNLSKLMNNMTGETPVLLTTNSILMVF